jgi:hypothetical protein
LAVVVVVVAVALEAKGLSCRKLRCDPALASSRPSRKLASRLEGSESVR